MVPLITICEIILIVNLYTSFIFVMILSALNTNAKYLVLLIPIVDFLYCAYTLWNAAYKITYIFLTMKTLLAVLYLMSQYAFIAMQADLIDSDYEGEGIEFWYVIFRLVFDLLSIYFFWSYVKRSIYR